METETVAIAIIIENAKEWYNSFRRQQNGLKYNENNYNNSMVALASN